nr:DUF3372 domain-containing protein [Xanthomonadales bacterium]
MQGKNLEKPRWRAAVRVMGRWRHLGERRSGLFEQIAAKTGAAAGLLMLLATASSAATLADCDAATHARTLHAAATTGLRASAAWLDATRIRWAGVAGSGRYRLHHSATAAIHARSGATVSGADWSIELTPGSHALSKAEQMRWTWLGGGTDLAVPAAEAARVPDGLRGQLLLTREDSAGRVLAVTQIQHPGALDALYAAAVEAPMPGATITPAGGNFRLWAPTAQAVAVCLYADGRAAARAVQPLTRDDATGFWSARVAEASGSAFLYLVDVAVPNVGIVRNRVTDPYALALSTDSARSYLIDLADPATKPSGWDTTPRPDTVRDATDLVIYELHVRDFSVQDATVPAARRGKNLAFTEAASNGVEHLQKLADAGITDVHLLPTYDLSTVPEAGCETPTVSGAPDSEAQQATVGAVRERDCFNWGYDPWHYTAPEGSYSSDPESPTARIREFRAMVQALHQKGLRVGLDVVYNHTFAAGQDAKSVLDRIVPGYYHRLNADGGIERSTCCENTATEHAMMARLMIDSAVIWARD